MTKSHRLATSSIEAAFPCAMVEISSIFLPTINEFSQLVPAEYKIS